MEKGVAAMYVLIDEMVIDEVNLIIHDVRDYLKVKVYYLLNMRLH